eukprot:6381113-Prymnesium_polylepis.1
MVPGPPSASIIFCVIPRVPITSPTRLCSPPGPRSSCRGILHSTFVIAGGAAAGPPPSFAETVCLMSSARA